MADTALKQKSEAVQHLLDLAHLCELNCADEHLIEKDIALAVIPDARAIKNDDYWITVRGEGRREYARIPGYLIDRKEAESLVPQGFRAKIDEVNARCQIFAPDGSNIAGFPTNGVGAIAAGAISAAALRARAYLALAA